MLGWISRAFHRADQFKRAVFASVKQAEIQEISLVLCAEEISLFLQMSVVDQRHSLDVYYTSLQVIKDFPDADPVLTRRAVLLHDLGKSRF
ncbi:HD domain-containing protein, partial [bacterium]|nr:HD domain-containing protein [bacterium]